jgi:general stress protein 26
VVARKESDGVFDLREYAAVVDSALADGVPCVLATADRNGRPNLGFKGSMMVFDAEHLAYWERSGGRHLADVRLNPHVAVQYFNYPKGLYLRFYGEAELHESGAVREEIMRRVVEAEMARDPERKGVGVLVRVHTVSDPFHARVLTRTA